jgi:cobalt-precorrin 5A hydrolase
MAPGYAGHAVAGEQAMMVAGLGCRRGTPAEEIQVVIALALGRLDMGPASLSALATLAEKAGEPGLCEAARRLALPLLACPREAMRAIADGIATRSRHAEAATGLPSIAEAAALVAAGPFARLRLARVATARATCAIAEGRGA